MNLGGLFRPFVTRSKCNNPAFSLPGSKNPGNFQNRFLCFLEAIFCFNRLLCVLEVHDVVLREVTINSGAVFQSSANKLSRVYCRYQVRLRSFGLSLKSLAQLTSPHTKCPLLASQTWSSSGSRLGACGSSWSSVWYTGARRSCRVTPASRCPTPITPSPRSRWRVSCVP